jgi:hypothetical protein
MTDGFTEVPLGRAGTGEAVILPQNQQFTNFSRDVLRLRMKEEEEKKQGEADLVGMLNDKDLAAKWTEDAIKQFIPKREAFEKEAIDIFKQTNGRLSPVQWFELKSKFGKLKQEVALNNELYKRDMDRVKELQKDQASANPVFDQKVSKELRKAYSNPWSDPEYAADIQKNYGGDVNAWRAANQGMFENVRAFSPTDYIKKKFNDKVGEEYVMDEQGRPVSQTTAEGRKFFTKRKFVPQEKIEAEVNTAFSGNTYDDTRFREHYQRKAGEVPINYSATGPLSMDEEGWKDPKEFTFMADAISNAPELASMKPEQQKQWVAKKLAAYDVGVNFPESRAIDWYDQRKGGKSGGGKTEKAPDVTIPSDYYNNVTQSLAQGRTPLQVAEDVGGKLVDKGQIEIPIEPTVAMKSIETSADKVLTNQSGKYRPLKEKGLVAGTPKTAVIMFKKNGVTVPMNTEGAKPYFQVIMQPVMKGEKAGVNMPSMGGETGTSLTSEVNRTILENNARIFKDKQPFFKVEYDLSDPVQNALVSKLYYGGTTISSNQYKREKQNIAPAPQKKTEAPFKMK